MSNATMEWLPLWVWPLLIVIGLALVGYVAVRLARDATRRTPSAGNAVSATARRVLDERFARGEIDEQEYRRRRVGRG
jgi:putative membrane protein